MRVLLLLLAVTLACAFARTEFEAQSLFVDFIHEFGKKYSYEDFHKRYQIFKDNLDKIDELNRKSQYATYGVNHLADLSTEEFQTTVLMKNTFTPTPDEGRDVLETKLSTADLPSSFDWGPKGTVTPVKNQGQCGSCWAFSIMENIESMWIGAGNSNNESLKLSAQQIVDCDSWNGGCNGGNPGPAYDYVIKAGGLEHEDTYPYTAKDGVCNFTRGNVQTKISNWKYATFWHSETTLKNNLVGWGPPSVCVDATNWHFYKGGVMTWQECAWINILNHCVQLTGYDETGDVPKWIVRNSWGTSWGVNGYIYLTMGSNTCGIANEATVAVV